MFTPAITASRVSPPDRITSIAFLQAARPFALEMTMGLAPSADAGPPPAAAAARAAVPVMSCRLLIIIPLYVISVSIQLHYLCLHARANSPGTVCERHRAAAGRQIHFPPLCNVGSDSGRGLKNRKLFDGSGLPF